MKQSCSMICSIDQIYQVMILANMWNPFENKKNWWSLIFKPICGLPKTSKSTNSMSHLII
jgi:hypothetical protein